MHAMAYRTIPFCYGLPAGTVNILGVATSNAKSARVAGEATGCDVWTHDYHELLARDDVDIVDVCVPNRLHQEVVTAAAQSGKHIYCEKPLAMNVAEARRMVDVVTEAGVKSQMTFNFRYFPAVTRAKQLIEDGFLGRVFSYRARYYRASYINSNKPLSWRLRKNEGGGALIDLGSHILDLIFYLLGDFDCVQSTMDTLIKQRPIKIDDSELGDVDVDDIAFLHTRMANGALGTVEISRMGTGTANDLGIEIFGDKGAIRFNAADPNWLEIYDTRDPGSPLGGMRGFKKIETVQRYEGAKSPDWTMPPSFVRTHAECQYQFLKAIDKDLPIQCDLVAGLHNQAVMAAADRSSTIGGWVKIQDLL